MNATAEAIGMQSLLEQLNTVPGVIGSLVSSADGALLARAFPAGHDEAALADVARALAEGAAGLATVTGPVKGLDLRYGNARVLARPAGAASLVFLCAPTVNLQPLTISAAVAAGRLEALRAPPASAAPPPLPAAAPAPASRLHAAALRVAEIIERKKLDPARARGEIAMRAGFGLGFIDADTPDDPEKLARLQAAAREVLGEPI